MHRLCIVDDEPSVRWRVQHMVRSLDLPWEAHAVDDGARALEVLEHGDTDLVLSDIRMPTMDGLSFIEQLRARGNSTLVAMLSAYTDFAYVKQAMRLGAIDYLAKPLDPDELRDVLLRARQILAHESGDGRLPELAQGDLEILRRRLLIDLLEGRLPRCDWQERARRLGIAGCRAQVVTLRHPGEAHEAVAAFVKDARRRVESRERLVTIPWDRTRTSLVICGPGDDQSQGPHAAGCGAALPQALEMCPVPDMRIGIGEARPIEDARTSYLESLRSLQEQAEGLGGGRDSALGSSTSGALQRAMQQACAWIEGHYAEPLTLDTVAREVHFHPKYLCTMFPLVAGRSFGEYLAATRLRHAKALLAETQLPCHAVAARVGYHNERCFSQAFRRRVGLTPSEYRHAHLRAGHS